MRCISSQGHAAIDMKLDPIDKASRIGGEEKCGARQLFRPAKPARRDQGSHAVFESRPLGLRYAQLGEDFGLDRSRAQDVYANPARLEFECPVFSKGGGCCL